MRILIACEIPEATVEQLRSLATELVYRPQITAHQLREEIGATGVLITGETRVSPEVIGAAPALQLIVHAGPGPGDLAVEAASARGVFVSDCPDQHAAAVAELAFGLLLALDRRIVEHTVGLREGRWNRAELIDARGMAGRTLGILGHGTSGRLVARRARAFDMRILAWSPAMSSATPPPPEPGVEFCSWPRDVARESDMVVLLAAPHEELQQYVDADFLLGMRPGAALVHLGHPGAVDEAALLSALDEGRIRFALDVVAAVSSGDPTRLRCRYCERPGVVGTQHIGPCTEQARQATADEILRTVRAYLVSGEVRNCLNLAERSPATWQLVLRVRDQVGVMAAILSAVQADGINAEEITSRVFTGAKAAVCTIALDERPSTEALEAIRALPDVLHLELRAVV